MADKDSGWIVTRDAETLSDNRYIHIALQADQIPQASLCPQHTYCPETDVKRKQLSVRRWAARNLENDCQVAATAWTIPQSNAMVDVIKNDSGSIDPCTKSATQPSTTPNRTSETRHTVGWRKPETRERIV